MKHKSREGQQRRNVEPRRKKALTKDVDGSSIGRVGKRWSRNNDEVSLENPILLKS